ncbi:B2 bradykinin receptor isoform X2 [Haliaeetus albicilla]|uniref:B2 bradykinin receptor n=2 Tax=Haliaeetus albicilla TaxID=8969 RepID=A0A091NXD0_HALAL|nr:PREDICTED: B2 bradykinin receptor-like [Haliaeetus albicilla]XP_010582205.1 PREDICTED: B2 bradykinin receptor-like [Haliaeetus leucocephalus]KFP99044.1 B2 bradykinin receptor [Haliaeetus albicilla]NWZ54653.1 BKRB2 protein [Haliaeetus albicilla]
MVSITTENVTQPYNIPATQELTVSAPNFHNNSEVHQLIQYKCINPDVWKWLRDFQPGFLWFIFILGAIENSFVLIVLCFHKSRCTVAEIYLANMAFADLMLVCALPFWAINISNKFQWPFGLFLCKAVNIMSNMNFYSSIYFLTLVSIDRYLALVKTMSLGRMRRTVCAKWNSFVVWTCALLICSPAMVFRNLHYYKVYNITACALVYPASYWEPANNCLLNIVGFVIPLCVITYCSIQIIKALRSSELQKMKLVQTERRATMLVLAVLLLFIICWLPFQISTFIDTIHYLTPTLICLEEINDILTQIAIYCAFSNSCLNPVLYVIVGKHFQKKAVEFYKDLFPKRCRKSQSVQMENSLDTLRTSISSEYPRKKSVFPLPR